MAPKLLKYYTKPNYYFELGIIETDEIVNENWNQLYVDQS